MIIETRPALNDDIAFARYVHHLAYRDVVERQYGSWDEESQDRYFAEGWEGCAHDIIVVDGATCGYTATEVQPDALVLYELAIHPVWQNRGIGTFLLRRLQARAQMQQLPVRLRTHLQNRARTFYQKNGFRENEQDATHVMMEWSAPQL